MDEFLHAQVVTFCWPEEVGWAYEVASERYVLNTTVLAYTEDMTGGHLQEIFMTALETEGAQDGGA